MKLDKGFLVVFLICGAASLVSLLRWVHLGRSKRFENSPERQGWWAFFILTLAMSLVLFIAYIAALIRNH